MLRPLVIIILCLISNWSVAQRLTLQDAIGKALQYNFDIRIAGNAAEQADVNNTMGNAGMLPSVDANGFYRRGTSNVFNQLASGQEQVRPNAVTSGLSGSIDAAWVIFDGTRMFQVKKQLDERQALTNVQLKAQIQSTVSEVIRAYAEVVWRKQQMVAIDTGIALAQVRMDLSKVQYESGSSAKVDYLQARVDHNIRRTDSLEQEAFIYQSLARLSTLLGEAQEQFYDVDNDLQLNLALQPLDKDRLKEVNLSLDIARRNVDISKLNAKIAKTYRYPTVTLDGSYVFNRNTSAAGFALFSRNYGPSGGISINMPLFRGGTIRQQAKVASLQAVSAELAYEKQNTEISRQYRAGWRNYQMSVAAYLLQKENIQYAKENVDIQKARFKAGIAITLETREAENSYVQALVDLYTAAYNVKVNETIVLELENRLVE